jgi:hypothetical protein
VKIAMIIYKDWIPACAGMTDVYIGLTLKYMDGMLSFFVSNSDGIIKELNEALAAYQVATPAVSRQKI